MQNRQKRTNDGARNRLAVPVSDKLKGGNMYECYEVCSKGKKHCCCECDLEGCDERCVGDMLDSDLVKYGDKPDGCFGIVDPAAEDRCIWDASQICEEKRQDG